MKTLLILLIIFMWAEVTSPEASAISTLNTIYVVGGVIILLAVGLVVFLSKRRIEIQLADTLRADALEKLLKVKEIELVLVTKERDEAISDKKSLEIEYKALLGIDIKELMDFWLIKESIEAKIKNVEGELRIERKRHDK